MAIDDLRVSYQNVEDGRVRANEALLEARSQLDGLNEKLIGANSRTFAAEDRASKLEAMLKDAERKLEMVSASLKGALGQRRDLSRFSRRFRRIPSNETTDGGGGRG